MQYLVKSFKDLQSGIHDLLQISSVQDSIDINMDNPHVDVDLFKSALRANVDDTPPGLPSLIESSTLQIFMYETSGHLRFGWFEYEGVYVFTVGTPKNGGTLTTLMVGLGWLSVVKPEPPPVQHNTATKDFDDDGIFF